MVHIPHPGPGPDAAVLPTVLDTVGATPMIALRHLTDESDASVVLKLERCNPGGSIKDRPAWHIVRKAEQDGLLAAGGTIIESSSGNFGISLAMIGAARDYRVIVIVDPKVTATNLAMLHAFGAEVIVVDEQDDTGSYHKTRIALANRLHREIPGSFRPDQCFNPLNSEAHYRDTAVELVDQSGPALAAVVATVSTGGQLGGISRYLREHAPQVHVAGVDAVGSTVFGGEAHSYLIPGVGLGWTPANVDDLSRLDSVYKVSDEDAFLACRVLARAEGVLVGGSTGAALCVALRLARQHGAGRSVALLAADSGERYLHTIYNDDWLAEHGLSPDTSPEELHRRVERLTPYSVQPAQTANYRPELAEQLGSPYASAGDRLPTAAGRPRS
ncbi:PLP-dependent cysteine synthase family protein [Saccharothrix algeriensis]|uniref:Cystathionine beta-synthase/cysteine synthase A n=1 Tax=Saccharothrix algeriensis TaxID=173560 RepID=A0A8T8HXC9_9PSEU|nr:cysteine synthase family protein [Saccharothrix algeriensis]MBM7814972.1 cystathionine beta-synthase/cysteine synthase A [Saccharothrix algeriensis]QTR03235.1 cysteine synthase family protein [Saccharothrix algeriensis]